MHTELSPPKPSYPLAELCVLVDLPPRTVRYYMQLGLVEHPQGETRAARYGAVQLEQLLQIKKWTAAGLSLERIRELLRGESPPVTPRAQAVGSIEVVRSHLIVADGVDVVISPVRAGLSPEQIRQFIRRCSPKSAVTRIHQLPPPNTAQKVKTMNPSDAARLQTQDDQNIPLLVHERAEGEQAADMPQLSSVAQMVPAGWGGMGSIRFSRKEMGADSMAVAPVSASGPAIPSVWRSKTRVVHSLQAGGMDELEIPAFLRKQPGQGEIDRHNPSDWTHDDNSDGYTSLTPLGVIEWLRINPMPLWPTTYAGLGQIGLGAWVVEWLKLEMAAHGGVAYPEAQVVEAFLLLMSRRETHTSEGRLGVLKSSVRGVRDALIGETAQPSAKLEGVLLQAMEAAMQGMTAPTWSQRVLSLEEDVGDMCHAR